MGETRSGLTLKLTDKQARLLWAIIDGAADAGACEGGLEPHEQRTLQQISDKMLPFMLKPKGGRNG